MTIRSSRTSRGAVTVAAVTIALLASSLSTVIAQHTSDLLPGVDLVTEEVEPGVYRVLGDGVRDLGLVSQGDRSERSGEIVVGRDRSVWLFTPDDQCAECPGSFYRLGDSATHRWPDSVASVGVRDIARPGRTAVALDGTVWAIVTPKDRQRPRLLSFDGQEWATHELPGRPRAVDIDASGTPWITTHRRGLSVGPPGSRYRSRSLGPDGSVTSYRMGTLLASPRGDILLNETARAFWKRDGEGWVKVALREDIEPAPIHGVGDSSQHAWIDDEGTIWMPTGSQRRGTHAIARFDDSRWTVIAREPGRDWGYPVGIATDGSVWFAEVRRECGQGLLRFDGASWQQHLDGRCPSSIDFAADGSVWVQTFEMPDDGWGGPVGTYVITPEAVAAAG